VDSITTKWNEQMRPGPPPTLDRFQLMFPVMLCTALLLGCGEEAVFCDGDRPSFTIEADVSVAPPVFNWGFGSSGEIAVTKDGETRWSVKCAPVEGYSTLEAFPRANCIDSGITYGSSGTGALSMEGGGALVAGSTYNVTIYKDDLNEAEDCWTDSLSTRIFQAP
jgi:hypothetical protein